MKRLRIARLDLRMKGIAPATARQAAQLIGPALARALADHPPGGGAPVDAGRLDVGAAPAPRTLATQIAQRIARTTQGE